MTARDDTIKMIGEALFMYPWTEYPESRDEHEYAAVAIDALLAAGWRIVKLGGISPLGITAEDFVYEEVKATTVTDPTPDTTPTRL